MARRPFGGTTADVAQDVAGDRVAGAQVTVWTAATGGTKLTDLQSPAGVALAGGVVTSDANGIIAFLGPSDGTAVVYLDGGLGGRTKMVATDLADRVGTLESTPGGVASVAGRTGVVVLGKGDVGLGNVDNTADTAKPVSAAQQAALDLKANLASPALTGTPTAPTPTGGDNSTKLATTAFVAASVGSSVASFNTRTGPITLTKGDVTDTGLAAADLGADAAGAATTAQAAAQSYAATQDTYQRLITYYGTDISGQPNKPWQQEPTFGPNLWALANFSTNTNGAEGGASMNTSTLTPTLTVPSTTTSAVITRISVPNVANNSGRWRFTMTVSSTGGTGNMHVRVRPVDSTGAFQTCLDASGNTLSSTPELTLAAGTNLTNYRFVYEIDLNSPGGTIVPTYLDVALVADAGSAGRTISLTAVDVRQMTSITPPIRVAWDTSVGGQAPNGNLYCYCPIGYDANGNLLRAALKFGPDNALELGFQGFTTAYEAAFTAVSRTMSYGGLAGQYPVGSLGANNSDTVISVYKADNTTTELRGNTHGGETGAGTRVVTDMATTSGSPTVTSATANFTSADVGQYVTAGNVSTGTTIQSVTNSTTAVLSSNASSTATNVTLTIYRYATDFQVFLDYGDGNGFVGPYLSQLSTEFWRNCVRVKIVTNTKLTRTDQSSPFATMAKTWIIYRDGTMRCSRTFTFTQSQKVGKWFWHMMSFTPNAGGTNYMGRLGRGQQVLRQVDFTDYLPAPTMTGAPSVTASGGSIPANADANAVYRIRVTALNTTGGESAPSLAYQTAHVGTSGSTITATWNAVSGATGYAVYFGLMGYERRVATVSGATTYTITGSETPTVALTEAATGPSTLATKSAMISSGLAEWSTYYDPECGAVVSMALDRTAALSMPDVAGIRPDLQRANAGLQKNYWILLFNNSGQDLPKTIPSGTVYSGDLWYFCYVPRDPANFEREQTLRGSSCAVLPVIYTSS